MSRALRRKSVPRERSPRGVKLDAVFITVTGSLAAVAVITLAATRLRHLFTPDGVAWTTPIAPQAVSAASLRLYTSNGPEELVALTGNATQLEIVVPEVNTISTICLGASVVIAALTALTVIACTARIAWLLRNDRFFTAPTSRSLTALTYTGIFGGVAAYAAWQLGKNGVEAALGAQASTVTEVAWWGWYIIAMFLVCAFGLVDIGLRRAIRLQRDTEGLV